MKKYLDRNKVTREHIEDIIERIIDKKINRLNNNLNKEYNQIIDINKKLWSAIPDNEYILYVILRDDEKTIRLTGGQYLAYSTTDVLKHVDKVDKTLYNKWKEKRNIVYLRVEGFKRLNALTNYCNKSSKPFKQIYIPHKDLKNKKEGLLGLVIGPVKRKDINLVKYELF